MKATRKKRGMGEGAGCLSGALLSSALPCKARGAVNVEGGAVRMGGAWREGASLSLFWCPLSALSPPSRPPAGVLCTQREGVCGRSWYV